MYSYVWSWPYYSEKNFKYTLATGLYMTKEPEYICFEMCWVNDMITGI